MLIFILQDLISLLPLKLVILYILIHFVYFLDVKIYNLAKLQLEKKLYPNVTHISSIDVHPAGDNIILGSYDCRLSWFDLDLSTKPYKSFRYLACFFKLLLILF